MGTTKNSCWAEHRKCTKVKFDFLCIWSSTKAGKAIRLRMKSSARLDQLSVGTEYNVLGSPKHIWTWPNLNPLQLPGVCDKFELEACKHDVSSQLSWKFDILPVVWTKVEKTWVNASLIGWKMKLCIIFSPDAHPWSAAACVTTP